MNASEYAILQFIRLTLSPEELRNSIEEQKSQKDTQPHPQELFSWSAPIRPYKKKSEGILRFYLAIAFLLTLLVFFFGDRILVLPIWSTIFVVYVLTVTPPPVITHRITKFGIDIAGITYRWDKLSHFYFVKRYDHDVLTIVGHEQTGIYLYLVIPDTRIKDMVMRILGEHLMYMKEPQYSATDKMALWLTSLMPGEGAPQADLSKTEA